MTSFSLASVRNEFSFDSVCVCVGRGEYVANCNERVAVLSEKEIAFSTNVKYTSSYISSVEIPICLLLPLRTQKTKTFFVKFSYLPFNGTQIHFVGRNPPLRIPMQCKVIELCSRFIQFTKSYCRFDFRRYGTSGDATVKSTVENDNCSTHRKYNNHNLFYNVFVLSFIIVQPRNVFKFSIDTVTFIVSLLLLYYDTVSITILCIFVSCSTCIDYTSRVQRDGQRYAPNN